MDSTLATSPRFRMEDGVGLAAAVVLHLAVVAAFVLQPIRGEVLDVPERMSVSLVSEVSLESTAPEIVTESRAAIAPSLSEEPQPVQPEPVVEPPPRRETAPRPEPVRVTRPSSRPITAPSPPPRQARRPEPRPSRAPAQEARGSRIGDDFLPAGAGNSTETTETRVPASEIGASARASIIQSIVRQIRPHWDAPNGVDAELLVTELAFELDEDGRLKGAPRVLRQSGINDSNRPQAPLHAERAKRAVRLATPFNLPDEYYNAWKSIRGARFDRNLSR